MLEWGRVSEVIWVEFSQVANVRSLDEGAICNFVCSGPGFNSNQEQLLFSLEFECSLSGVCLAKRMVLSSGWMVSLTLYT